ncbi:hypothetical protein [Leifsonia sp. 1010]|uniref:hypothetical protein n=1 Tax=Leifsonia sp. 1010 TaxID=2817769 RepID=UPI00285FE3FA|nr:hypothetical protein [Leifsonia sp. 1010]MDR6612546.1 hypothetical protein [Leifsonia sp. 1010]
MSRGREATTAADATHKLPDDVIAIAIDTNAAASGRISFRQIEDLAATISAQELQIEVWVPEPVLWEWADHAYDLAVRTRDEFRSRQRELEDAGISGFDVAPSFEQSVDDVMETLSDGLQDIYLDDDSPAIRILELSEHPDAAVLGLRDQVLRTGPGRTKPQSGARVKTGAADSASFRLVAHAAGDQLHRVVLASGDQDARTHFRHGPSPIILRDLWSVRNELIKLRKGSDVAAEALKESVESALTYVDQDGGALRAYALSGENLLFNPRRDLTHVPEFSVVRVSAVDSVDNVEISLKERSATATAKIRLDVAIEYVRWDYRSETVDSDLEEEQDVEAIAYISADAPDLSDWDFTIDRIEIVDGRYDPVNRYV